jgi:hypothetical protein
MISILGDVCKACSVDLEGHFARAASGMIATTPIMEPRPPAIDSKNTI